MTPAFHGVFQLAGAQTPAADVTINLEKCTKTAKLLRQLGRALSFPDWYGANFDALFDCLTDPEVPAKIHLHGLSTYAQRHQDDFAVFVEVLRAACEARAEAEAPLTVWLDVAAADLPLWPGA
ncbi:MAG: barstar family protein [Dechloromonas sp.]|nr:barstar family protein [Dechloromonas sp.]